MNVKNYCIVLYCSLLDSTVSEDAEISVVEPEPLETTTFCLSESRIGMRFRIWFRIQHKMKHKSQKSFKKSKKSKNEMTTFRETMMLLT